MSAEIELCVHRGHTNWASKNQNVLQLYGFDFNAAVRTNLPKIFTHEGTGVEHANELLGKSVERIQQESEQPQTCVKLLKTSVLELPNPRVSGRLNVMFM